MHSRRKHYIASKTVFMLTNKALLHIFFPNLRHILSSADFFFFLPCMSHACDLELFGWFFAVIQPGRVDYSFFFFFFSLCFPPLCLHKTPAQQPLMQLVRKPDKQSTGSSCGESVLLVCSQTLPLRQTSIFFKGLQSH